MVKDKVMPSATASRDASPTCAQRVTEDVHVIKGKSTMHQGDNSSSECLIGKQLDSSLNSADDTRNSHLEVSPTKAPSDRPWYVRGGLHLNPIGSGFMVSVPPILLLMTAEPTSLHPSITPMAVYWAVTLIQAAIALAEGKVTFFCVVVVPLYLASLLAIPGTLSTSIAPTLALALFIALWRLGICMSVCLHRYAAHAAFKCSPTTRFFLHVLGCAANQGGPIWWVSQHRCHHKHCDAPRDPHSPIQDGVERAFAFFSVGHEDVDEEFASKHNDTWLLRLLDTWSFVVCGIELYLAYCYFGREGLFVSYTSMWICQTGTLWFNIINHPPDGNPEKACQASNSNGGAIKGYYPMFWLFDFMAPLISAFISESAHADHHVHFMLAKRDKYDVMYHSFVWPLEKMGLLWDVKVAPPE